ncbi:MAG: type II toxin-antitoxin system VapC family toxin [Nitrososphaerota archaeon]
MVLDASVIAKLIMREENYEEAGRKILEDGETLDLAMIEVANTVLKYFMRGEIKLAEAEERYGELVDLFNVLDVKRATNFLGQAFEASLKLQITIYDSLYIVSSDRLITADSEQAKAAMSLGKSVTMV